LGGGNAEGIGIGEGMLAFDFRCGSNQRLIHREKLDRELFEEAKRIHRLGMTHAPLRGKPDRYPNLTIKKIPKAVLSRCEWGKEDYSLQVENLPKAPPQPGQMDLIAMEGD
jgi:adenine-specific DNA-methyltransferase